MVRFFHMSETNRIEYKRELTKDLDLEKEVIAFLNYQEGGIIYIGIDKDGSVTGVENEDSDMLKIKDRLKNNIQPSCLGLFDVRAESRGEESLIRVTIASGPEKPYFKRRYGMTEKGCFIRIGTASEPMTLRMIEELFARRTRNSLGKIVSRKQDLRFEQLRIFYEEAGFALNENFASNLELLAEPDKYNYIAYLLSDINSTSIKVAKYSSLSRTDLSENNEYGYACLIRAAKRVLDKIELENPTSTRITSKERVDTRLWDMVALREAIINAFVHNDFTGEVPPKFEIFPDRIEITSAGGLPEGLSQEEFFRGFSVPRNQELMRIFKDLGMVEQLGSGVPRILESYGRECFAFSDHFLRMSFPVNETIPPHVTPHVTPQVKKLILAVEGEMTRQELQDILELSDRMHFLNNYLKPAFESGAIEMTIPDKPKSRNQRYRLTEIGEKLKENQ